MVVQEAHKGPSRQVLLQGLEQLLWISELCSTEDCSQPLDATTKYERYPPANVGLTKSVGGGGTWGLLLCHTTHLQIVAASISIIIRWL